MFYCRARRPACILSLGVQRACPPRPPTLPSSADEEPRSSRDRDHRSTGRRRPARYRRVPDGTGRLELPGRPVVAPFVAPPARLSAARPCARPPRTFIAQASVLAQAPACSGVGSTSAHPVRLLRAITPVSVYRSTCGPANLFSYHLGGTLRASRDDVAALRTLFPRGRWFGFFLSSPFETRAAFSMIKSSSLRMEAITRLQIKYH